MNREATMAALEKLWNAADDDTRTEMELWIERRNHLVNNPPKTPEQIEADRKQLETHRAEEEAKRVRQKDWWIEVLKAGVPENRSRLATFRKKMLAANPDADINEMWAYYLKMDHGRDWYWNAAEDKWERDE
jgi:hypothetical protein